jgi:hypothetical protein
VAYFLGLYNGPFLIDLLPLSACPHGLSANFQPLIPGERIHIHYPTICRWIGSMDNICPPVYPCVCVYIFQFEVFCVMLSLSLSLSPQHCSRLLGFFVSRRSQPLSSLSSPSPLSTVNLSLSLHLVCFFLSFLSFVSHVQDFKFNILTFCNMVCKNM